MILPESKTVLVEHSNKKVYDLGDKIAKVFNADKPISDVFNEALNLARINEAGVRSPKALEVSEDDGEGWALVTDKVPGVTLAEKMAAEPSSSSSTCRSRSTACAARCSTASATSTPA